MLSNYSSFLEFSAGVYASICFDDILKNIWSSQYYYKIRQIFSRIKVYSYTNLSKELIDQNQEWVLSLQKPMIKRAVLMLFVISVSLLFAGAEEELQKTEGLLSQIRTSFVIIGFFILFIYFIVLKRLVFKNWPNLVFSVFALIIFSGALIFIIISNKIACPFCDKFFTPLFISFILFPLIWQIIVSWVYSSLHVGYVREKIEQEIQEYTLAIDLLYKKNKTEMPNGYSNIYTNQVLRDADKANDTCVELFNERLLKQIKDASQPNSTFCILKSWIKFKIRNLWTNEQTNSLTTTKSAPSKYSMPEQILKSSTITLKLDYAEAYKNYCTLKKKYKKKGARLGLKEFCREYGHKYEEMKLWLEQRDRSSRKNTK